MLEPIVILGAGPAGLACARTILKNSPGKRVLIVDSAAFVGGAGASFQWKGHTLDYGPHAFHTRGSQPEMLVRELFANDPDLLVEGRKMVHVYLNGKRLKYPLQIGESLLKFNPFLSALMIIEFIATSLFHAVVSIPIENFENWGRKRFGAKLYKLSFGDYTEKVWKTKASKISEKFASEKIQGFSFVNLIRRLFRVGGQVTEPYFQTWLYPKQGSGELYKRLGEEICSRGGEFLLATKVDSINRESQRVTSLTVESGGSIGNLPCSWLVNTIPLPHFIRTFGEGVPFIVRHHASKLRYISLVLVYIEFAVERVSEDHWFYLLDPKFKFNRVTEQKNLSPATQEPGKTVLSFELTCRVGDAYWTMTDEELFDLAKADCKQVHFLLDKMDRITDFLIKRVPNVYEIYFKHFDQHAEVALGYLQEFEKVCSIGRRGLFLQGDQHQAVEMGIHMGDLLSAGTVRRHDLDNYLRKYVRYIDDY
jgi:protoporphyrinogen oxidase